MTRPPHDLLSRSDPATAPLEVRKALSHDLLPHSQKHHDALATTPPVRTVAHPPRAVMRDQLPGEALEASLMSSVSAPTRTARLDNFAWWHRLRRHKIERGGQWWSGWNSGMLALVLHCQKCNVEWNWTVR
jgi:hypothetical protein